MPAVLIVADLPGRPQVALERGLVLAQKIGATVEVVGFCYESLAGSGMTVPQQKQLQRKLIAQRKSELKEKVADLKQGRLKTAIDVIWEKDLAAWVSARCAASDYAAVIKTAHRSSTLTYTSTDWHLLRDCKAPVMICAEKKWRKTRPILAAVDAGSSSKVKQRLNRQVLDTATQWATALGTEVVVLHAFHVPAVLAELDLVDEYTHAQKMKAQIEPRLQRLAAEFGLSSEHVNLKKGPVDKVITSEAARTKAQLVVMGTVGRRGVKARLIGNTAERVLERLRTDVLAIKPR